MEKEDINLKKIKEVYGRFWREERGGADDVIII